ncbi:hypothetical protein C8F04DRAFT_1181435 [Mycena alexandri]|uniref:Uncharacterized protein n=1 Tax=Mycena alexandri TaxID=1745969 RepID=A0AAD6SZM2_9AGAR|nr:hypothetical protein C8F04DRAFT_1181435 [Mycena alexandri]
MARWIGDSKAAEVAERAETAERAARKANRSSRASEEANMVAHNTCSIIRGGRETAYAQAICTCQCVMEEEAVLMEALATADEMEAGANAAEDARPDEGQIEIDSDDEYR